MVAKLSAQRAARIRLIFTLACLAWTISVNMLLARNSVQKNTDTVEQDSAKKDAAKPATKPNSLPRTKKEAGDPPGKGDSAEKPETKESKAKDDRDYKRARDAIKKGLGGRKDAMFLVQLITTTWERADNDAEPRPKSKSKSRARSIPLKAQAIEEAKTELYMSQEEAINAVLEFMGVESFSQAAKRGSKKKPLDELPPAQKSWKLVRSYDKSQEEAARKNKATLEAQNNLRRRLREEAAKKS